MAILEANSNSVTQQHQQQCHHVGGFLLKHVGPQYHLELLRRSAQLAIDPCDAEMDRRGVNVLGLNHRGNRYFSALVFKQRPELRQFLFSDLMAPNMPGHAGAKWPAFLGAVCDQMRRQRHEVQDAPWRC